MELEEETAGIAEHSAHLVAAPERRRRRLAVLACRLCGFTIVVSHGRHDGGNATPAAGSVAKGGVVGVIRCDDKAKIRAMNR
jgi:hypothetical protein